MLKRVISLSLCLMILLTAFVGCAKKEKDPNDKGAFVTMYLSDPVYNFDPALAYQNESVLKVASLMFETLFKLDGNGKIKKALAKDYDIIRNEKANEYKMIITLNTTRWSDGTSVTANDVVYAWKRLLNVSNSFDAAAMLYDIKNAREAKAGDASIDDVCVYALNESQVEIQFVGDIDYDRFLLNLTSCALAPLREEIVTSTTDPFDWAKKSSMFFASGPFRLKEVSYAEESAGLVLERNSYYYRNTEEDSIDKYVTPYRLIIDYTKTDEEIMQEYQNGNLFFVGDIPLSVRGNWKDTATVTDALSTHTYILNSNAIVRYYNQRGFEKLSSNESVFDASLVAGEDGDQIFANAKVREALSLALDREAIANAIVFAKAATALVPYGVFDYTSKKDMFREVGGDVLATTANMAAAKEALTASGIDASKYMFAISVASYDDVHMEIAKMVQTSWNQLGFHVAVNAIDEVENKDKDKTTKDAIAGIRDDMFAENYAAGNFEVAAIDYTAFSADAFSVLAPFAKGYTGGAATGENSVEFSIPAHIAGYDCGEYNDLINGAFNAPTKEARTEMLHQAESVLLRDLPVIPIIFNQNATLAREEISKYDFTYYGTPVFTEMKLKDYMNYIPEEEKEKMKK
ncbi:MAG: hypothetical protein IJX94_04220 [Clostridia bacterium]|nr:hypothetical protein [Clostridia bacterium]